MDNEKHIAKLNAEIERLKSEICWLREELRPVKEWKTLLTRAADELELAISSYGTEYEQALIDELRMAAE